MFPYTHGVIASSASGAPVVDNDFVIRVKTDNAGTSGSDQFTLPLVSGQTYNATIDWGDGNTTNQTTDVSPTHTYSTAGEYIVTISGTFPTIRFNNGGDKLKLIETLNFGNVGWTSLTSAFFGCSNNVINSLATGDFSTVTNCSKAWKDNTSIAVFPAIDFTICTIFTETWMGCTSLATFGACDMSAGTSIQSTWQNCALTSFPLIDLSSGTNFISAWRNNGVMSSFATRNFYAMSSGTNCFNGTTLPTSDYSDILITQNANNANTGVAFHGGSSNYDSSASSARANLVSTKLWTITDAGLV